MAPTPTGPDSLYTFRSYSLVRRDRPSRLGGGVMIFFHPSLATSLRHRHDLQSLNGEDLWAEVKVRGLGKIILACIYRPPSSDRASVQNFLSSFEHSLRLASSERCPILVTGDFNFKNSSWCSSDVTDYGGESLQYILDANSFDQIVRFPTRVNQNSLKSCLDLVLTSPTWPTTTITSSAPIGHSDHLTILGTICSTNDPPTTPQKAIRPHSNSTRIPLWSAANIKTLNETISCADWSDIYESTDVDEAWRRWKTKLSNIISHTLPHKRVTTSERPQPWLTRDLRSAIRLKHHRFREYLKDRTPEKWTLFKEQRNTVTALTRRAKSNYVTGLDTAQPANANTHPRPPDEHNTCSLPRLYKLTRSLLGRNAKEKIPQLETTCPITTQKISATTDTEKAEALNNFFIFQNAQSIAPSGPTPSLSPDQVATLPVPTNKLSSLTVTTTEVEKVLNTLDTKKSSGTDGISLKVLKSCAPSISKHLATIFNRSLSSGSLPRDWLDATITPVYKRKGQRTSPNNYRPISLLSCTSKVLEKLVSQKLYQHTSCIIPTAQSGFRKHDNTGNQLTRIVHQLSAALDDRCQALGCFFDLSKAFDRVSHQGLLKKLQLYNIDGDLLTWMTAYLTLRRQRVRVAQSFSKYQNIPAGVPQGSVLGPLLFVIYTADLPSVACPPGQTPDVSCNLFADDTALISIGHTATATTLKIQPAVTRTGIWLNTWSLMVNAPNRPPYCSLGQLLRAKPTTSPLHLAQRLSSNAPISVISG